MRTTSYALCTVATGNSDSVTGAVSFESTLSLGIKGTYQKGGVCEGQ